MIPTSKMIAVFNRVSTMDQKKKETIWGQINPNCESIQRLLKENGGPYQLYSRSPLKRETDLRKIHFCDEAYNLEAIEEGTALFELLNLVKAGEVHAIKVDNTDRLFRSRERMVIAQILDIIEEHDVKIYDHNGEVPQGLLLEIMSSLGSNNKREIIRKLQNGKIAKLKRTGGPLNNKEPFGFRWNSKKEVIEVVEEEAKIVRWCVAATSGKTTADMPEMIRMLVDEYVNKWGVPDPKLQDALTALGFNMRGYYQRTKLMAELERNPSGRLHDRFIYVLMREPKYIGSRTTMLMAADYVGKGKTVPAEAKTEIEMKYPAIVSPKEWREMEIAREMRTKYYGKGVKHDYLVKDLVVCSGCGLTMQSVKSQTSRYVRSAKEVRSYSSYSYKCNTASRYKRYERQNKSLETLSRCAIKNNHKQRDVDSAVWDAVREFILQPDFITPNEKIVRDDIVLNKVIQKLESDISSIDTKIKEIESQEERMLERLANSLIDDLQWAKFSMNTKKQRSEFNKIKRKLVLELDGKRKKLREAQSVDLEAIRTQYRSRFDEMTFAEKRAVTIKVVKRVVLSSDKVNSIEFYSPASSSSKS